MPIPEEPFSTGPRQVVTETLDHLGRVLLKLFVKSAIALGMLFFFIGILIPRRDRVKPCLAHQRVIQGAVELYNLEVPEAALMHSLASDSLDILERRRHLTGKPLCAQGGIYSGTNLTASGTIRCSIHGSLDNPMVVHRYPWGDNLVELNRAFFAAVLSLLTALLILFLW